MVAPIQSLMNMEMALYGGFGSSAYAPSYLNGYCGGNNYSSYNPSFYGYGNTNNATFGQNIPYGYGVTAPQQQTQQVAQESVFQGLSQVEQKALMNDYKKSLVHSEGFLACAGTNAAFAALMNPRLIAHPINTFRATFTAENATNKLFNALKNDPKFIELWKNPENSNILREAWLQHNKAVARCEGKLGAFRRSFQKTGIDAAGKACSEVHLIESEIRALEAALKSGNMEAIAQQTARLQQAYSVNSGFMSRGWNKVKGLFTDVNKPTVTSALQDNAAIAKRTADLNATKATGYGDILKRGGGVKGGLFFMGIEFLLSFGKIKTAFQKDNETGMKQLGQTTVKAAGNAAGWAVGEAAGVWAFTKWGAKIGSKVHPLLGTLIGGAVGLIGGGLGMWLAGKGTNALVGQDVADDIEAKKLAKSQEGQVQLLQNTMQRIQKGEKVSADAQMAVQKLMQQYA